MASPCNAVTVRYKARSAWVAATADEVGVYFATDEGVVFTRVPAKVFASVFLARLDVNRNPLPLSTDLTSQAGREAALHEQIKAVIQEKEAIALKLATAEDHIVKTDAEILSLKERVMRCEEAVT